MPQLQVDRIDPAVEQLLQAAGGDAAKAAALIDLLEEDRRAKKYVCYWQPSGDQLQFWERLRPEHRIWLICGGNGCLTADTLVSTPRGSVPISEIDVGDLVYASDGTPTVVLRRFENGNKKVWRWHGKKRMRDVFLDATEDHKVVFASQKDNSPRLSRLRNIGTRSYFVLSNGIDFGEQQQPMALLIGLLLGDGYIAGKELQWTCADPDLVEELRTYIVSFGVRLASRGIQHYLREGVPWQRGKNQVKLELQRLGLFGCLSGNKFIPEETWHWSKADVAQLLSGLIATDGSVFRSSSGWKLGYTSCSRDLAEGFSKLLSAGFGIYGSTICKGNKGTWTVTYANQQAMERLSDLPVPGRKGRLLKAVTFAGKNSKGSLIPVVDREYLGELPTYDLLVNHPSHVFQLDNGIQVANSGKTDLSCWLQTVWLLGKDYFRGESAWKWVEPLPVPDRPASVRAVGLTLEMLRDPIFEKLTGETDHPAFWPNDAIEHKNTQSFTVRFKNGSKWQGKSADVDPKTHGGPTIDLDCLDEECSYAIYQENYQRIRKGGFLLITATPLDDVGTAQHPWIFDLIQQAEDGDPEVLVMFMSSLNNPHLDEDFKRKQIARWKGHPEEQARLYGKPIRRSGLYYKDWRAEPPLWVPARDLVKDTFRVCVVDPAATGPAAALWLAYDKRGNQTLYREYKDRDKTIRAHVEAIIAENRGDPINLWLMDPYMGRQSVPTIEKEHKTVLQLWRDAGLSRLRLADVDADVALEESREYLAAAWDSSATHPRMEVFDHLDQFREEIERCVLDTISGGQRRGEIKDRPRKGHDDLLNCWQYASGMKLRARATEPTAPIEAKYRSYCN